MMFDGAALATAAAVLEPDLVDKHSVRSHQAAETATADHHASFAARAYQDSHGDAAAAVSGYSEPAPADAPASSTSVIFIDSSVENYAELASEWSGRGEVVIIDSTRDGLEQMLGALAGRSDISAIHIVSHGAPDAIQIGTTRIDQAAVEGELAASFAAIGAKLSADGDILLYGCSVDPDDGSMGLLNVLAAKTGADIAASDDPTGSAAKGGDWDLEVHSGTIEATALVSDRYDQLLQLSNPSSAWTISGNSGSTTIDGVTVTITFTSGSATFAAPTQDTLNNIAAFANSAQGTPDLSTVFNNAGTLLGTGTITLTFSEAVTNPIVHIDRLGGVVNNLSNTATLTLTNSGATITKLSGSDHLVVVGNSISRQIGITTANGESSLTNSQGTAAGSIRVNGTYTTLTFQVSSSAGDGFELSASVDRAPDAQNDAFTTNRGATLTGNLFADNGSGPDADVTNDALTITQVNGASFTVGQPITLSNGALTITNATTGAFTFTPSGAYPLGPQSFTYTIADANGGTDTATVTIAVNDPPVIALDPVNLVTNGSFETASTWKTNTGAIEYSTAAASFGIPAPPDGISFAEVEGAFGARYIEQTITTVVGQQYTYSLQAITRIANNVGDKGSLWVNGVKLLDFTTSTQWQTYLATFTATSTASTIRIQSEGSISGTFPGNADSAGLMVDDVQVHAINATVAYTENGAATPITSTGDRIYDFDNTTLASATVTLTNPQTGDRLLVNGSAAASGTIGTISWTRTNTVVTFTGSATKAQYEAAIRLVQFENTTDDPGATQRTITITASDGIATSNVVTVSVNVTPVNDAPVNTLPGSYSMAEDSGPLALTGLSVTDVDAGTGTMTVTLSVPSGSGALAAVSGSGVTVTGSGGNSIVLSGTASAINAYLASAARPTYSQVADFNGSVVLTMVSNDGGNSGTGGALSDTDTVTITISAVADIVADTVTLNEDGNIAISPLANDSFENASPQITQVAGQAIAVGQTVNVTNGTVRLNAGNQLVFTPSANFNGSATFSYTVTSGGVTETANIVATVNAVNDAPSGTDAILTATEDTPRAFSAADFGFSDPVEGNAFAGVVITTLPANGTLTLNGSAVSAGNFVTAAQIAAGQLVWTPAADANGNGLGAFTFQVRDNGGTANGGVDTDPTPNAISFNVAAVNDAPIIGPASQTLGYTENAAPTVLFDATTTLVDVDNANLAGVTVTLGGAQTGDRLLVNGSAAASGTIGTIGWTRTDTLVTFTGTATIAQYLAALRQVQFENTGDNPGATNRTITATASDGALTSAAATRTVMVTPVNDPIVNTLPASYTVAEDGALTLSGLSVADPDAGTGMISIHLSVPAGSGTITATTSGGVTVAGSGSNDVTLSGTLANINTYLATTASQPVFRQATADFNGTVTLTMTSNDGGNTGGAATSDVDAATITITPVADIVADTVSVNEDASVTISPLANDSFENASPQITTIAGQAITVGQTVSVSNGTATLNAGNQIVFTPSANFNGSATFSYTVTSGGVTETANIVVTVNSVNDAPSGTDATLSGTEDTARPFTASDFGFTDSDGNAFAGVVITTLPASGTLSLNGIPVTAGSFVSAAQLAAGGLVWTPAANANGAGLGSFTFQVRDNGGTANGGVDTDPTPNTISFTVAAVNDAPLLDLSGTATAPFPVSGGSFTLAPSDVGDRTVTATVDLTDTAPGAVSMTAGFATIDNSFRLSVNGTALSASTFELDPIDLTTGESLLTVADGSAVASPGAANGNGLNRVEVRISPTGVTFWGTRSTTSTVYEQLFLAAAVAQPVFTSGVNTIAITNTQGNGVEGMSGTVTVTAQPSNFAVTYTENGAPIAVVDTSATIADDGSTLASATVMLTNAQSGDFLTVNGSTAASGTVNGIAYTRTASSVTLTGTFTPQQYTDALKLVGFANSSDNPNTTVVRDITVKVNDGALDSNVAHSRITVIATNDPVVNTVRDYTVSEDAALVLAGLSVADPDAGAGSISVTLQVPAGTGNLFATSANGVTVTGSGTRSIVLNGTLSDIDAYLASAANQPIFRQGVADFNGTVTLTMTSNDGGNTGGPATTDTDTATITITPVADIVADTVSVNEDTPVSFSPLANDSFENAAAQITTVAGQAIVQGQTVSVPNGTVTLGANNVLTFTPAANFNGTSSFSYTVTSGGTTETATIAMTVNAVNDAPTLSVPATIAATEDTALAITGISFADVDAGANAVRVTLSAASGNLSWTTAAGVTFNQSGPGTLILTGSIANINAAIAAGRLTYTPVANANGPVTLVTTINDQGNVGIDPGQSGDAASEEASATTTIQIAPVDDAPDANDDSFATSENTPVTVVVLANDTDVDSPSLTITQINGQAISAGGSVAVTGGSVRLNADGTLTYTPTAGFSGAPSFSYTISDGTLTDTATVFGTVGAINHAPQGTDTAIAGVEDTPVTISAASFGYSDSDGNAFIAVRITTLPANGTLTLAGAAVAAGQMVSKADVDAGRLVWTPAANATGSGLGAFTFQVQDDGGTANGGRDTNPTPNTMTFTVAPVNDPPSGTDATLSATEDTPYVFAGSNFGFSDPAEGNAFAGVVISTLPADGTLILAGTAVSAGQFVTAADIAAGRLVWTPAANANGSALGQFTFQVRDNGGTANGGIDTDPTPNTIRFNVAAVNDPPVAQNDSFTTAEDTPTTIAVLANDSDPDAGAVLTVTAVNGTAIVAGGAGVAISSGTVTLNGAGQLVFTPSADFNGAVSFGYTIRDEAGATASATVSGTVTPVADPVVNTVPATASGSEDTPLVFNSANGNAVSVGNPDGGTVTVTLGVQHGTLSLSGTTGLSFAAGTGTNNTTMTFTGTAAAINAALNGLTYRPNADYYGADQIAITSLRNADGASDSDTIALTIAPIADAVADTVTTPEDTPFSFNVLTGAGGASADNFEDAGRTLTAVTQPAQGSVSFSADGTVTYTPPANFNGTTSFVYTITAGGVTETQTVTINVTPVNDAPVLDLDASGTGTGTGYATGYTENGAGVPIVDSDVLVLDVDSANLTSATIRITNGASGDLLSVGALPGGITASYDASTYTLTLSGSASAAAYQTALAAVRYASSSENPGPSARSIDVSVSDGQLVSNIATATVAITRVNDAPQGADATLSAVEDTPYTFHAADFGFSDPAEGDAFAGVVITTVPANGTMRLNGTPVTAGTFVTVADLAAGRLNWLAAQDARGPNLGQFTFQVRDSGGTANGGIDTDPSPNTIAFTVANVNDAPVSSDGTVTLNEDTATTAQLPGYTDPDGDTATYRAGSTAPAHGTVTINANGSYTYTPNANFNGTDRFSFIVDDGNGGTTEQFMAVTVTPVNDPPVLDSEIPDRNRPDGASVNFDVSGYFSDRADGDTLSFTATGLPGGLTLVNGVISGTIDRNASIGGPGSNGVYSVTVTASDGKGGTVSDTFVFTVINPVPTAVNDTVAVNEDATVTFSPITGAGTTSGTAGADSDPDGDPLTVTAVGGQAIATGGTVAVANGTVTLNADGTLTFAPKANFNGSATMSYTISDGNGGTAQALITITVAPQNDAPSVNPIADQTRSDDSTVSFDAGSFFSDIDGDTLSFTATGLPPGLAIDPATGRISGTIAAGASGPTGSLDFTVVVTASDGNGGTTSTSFRYTVVNLSPVARDDTATTAEDTPVDIAILANDSDPDGDALTVVRVSNQALTVGGPEVAVTHGTVALIDDAGTVKLHFTPGANFNGTESFTYTVDDGNGGLGTATVSITVTPVNDQPTAAATIPDLSRADGQSLSYDMGDFFSDPDGDTLRYVVTGLPAGLSYDPATGLISGVIGRNASQGGPGGDGTYAITVTATDRTDGTGLSASRTFQLAVTNPAPTAVNDSVSVAEDTPVRIPVLENDTDPDGDPLTVVAANAGKGTVTIDADGAITYTPPLDYNGADTVTYTISDGNGGTSTGQIAITVTPVNDAPTATAIPDATSNDDAPFSYDIGAYFHDVDAGDQLQFAVTQGALPPGVALDPATGVISGTLASNASEGTPYVVTITATDGSGATVSRTLTWEVRNQDPVASNDTLNVGQNQVGAGGNVLDNDVDPDNDGKQVVNFQGSGPLAAPGEAVTGSNGGTFVVNADGSYTFDPGTAFEDLAPGTTRTTSITYLMTDTDGGFSSATLTVVVGGANDAPVAGTLPDMTQADGQTLDSTNPIDLSAYFTDPDGDPLTFTATGLPDGLSMDASGRITGTVAAYASAFGPYTVTVTATDSRNASTSATFTYNVSNPAPTASNDTVSTSEDTPVDVDVLANDFDPDGDDLAFDRTFPPQAANGTVTINPDGTLHYVPNADYNGIDTIVYRITDGQGGYSTAIVNVAVATVNDPPVGADMPNMGRNDGETLVIDAGTYFSDPDGDDLTFAITGLPQGLTFDPQTGRISGRIAASASGSTGRQDYTVTVTADDGQGGTATRQFTLTTVNLAPTANDDSAATTEGTAVTIPVLANDTDADGDALVVVSVNTIVMGPGVSVNTADGTVTLVVENGVQKLVFTPRPNFNGTTTFSYSVSDGNGGFDDAVVTLTVAAVNDPPTIEAPIPDHSRPDGASVSFPVGSYFSDVDGDALTYQITGLPPGLTFDPQTGLISGTLASNASQGGNGGAYTVTVTARDPSGASVSQSFVLTASNLAPTAANDTVQVAEDGSVTFNPITGDGTISGASGVDVDPDGDPLQVVAVDGTPIAPGTSVTLTNGTLAMNADGSLTFTPRPNFNGPATIAYTVSDGNGATAQAIITIDTTAVNDAPTLDLNGAQPGLDTSAQFTEGDAPTPIAPNAVAADVEDGIVSLDIALAGFVDGAQEIIHVDSQVWFPAGTAATGTIVFGDTTFRYAYDGAASLHFENAAGAGTPIPANTINALILALQYENTSGAPTMGNRTLGFTLTDQGGASTATAFATVTIGAVNSAPVGTPIATQTADDAAAVTFDVSGFFSDPDSPTLTFTATGLPPGLTIDPATGVISGTLPSDASRASPYLVTITASDGTLTATQQFTWSIANPAPIAVNDTASGAEEQALTGNVTPGTPGQDFDPDGDPLTVSAVNGIQANVGASVAGTSGGRFVVGADGAWRFDPSGDFNALAAGQTAATSITYTISDGQGGLGSATLTVTVNGTNDAPISTDLPAASANDGASVTIPTAGAFTDPDAGDVFTFAATGLPSGLSIDPATGEITGILAVNASQTGPYAITITATDRSGAQASTVLVLTASNPAPVATDTTVGAREDTVLTGSVSASDVDGDTLTFTLTTGPQHGTITLLPDGRYTYTPVADFNGSDSFSYSVSDGNGGTASATVTIAVAPVNDAPIASAPPANAAEDTPVNGQITASDVDGDPITFTIQTQPAHGTLVVRADGSYTYTPQADFNGTDSFVIAVSDGQGGTTLVTVPVAIAAVNDAPVISTAPIAASEDTPISGQIAASDVDGDPLTFAVQSQPAHGTLTLTASGAYTYTPDPDFNGADSFVVTVGDGQGGTTVATIPILVAPVNDAPVASAPPANAVEDTPVTGQITASDVDGDPITFTVQTRPAHGTLVVRANGSYTYTPNADSNGTDSFVIAVSDGQGGTTLVTVPVAIAAVNDAPVDAGEDIASPYDGPVTLRVLDNASDVDGNTLTVVSARASVGTVVINADGTITFTPPTGFLGTATIVYEISDGNGGLVQSTATVAVGAGGADINALLEGDPFTRDVGDALLQPGALPTVTAGGEPQAPLTISQAVNGVRTLVGTADLRVDDPIILAVNAIRPLDGTAPVSEQPIAAVTDAIGQRPVLRSEIDPIFDSRFDPFAIDTRTGFSLRPSSINSGQIAVESIVRDTTLYLELTDTRETDGARIVEFQVRSRDGKPLPDWVRVDRRGLVTIERPVGTETLQLIVVGLRADGSRIELPIVVQSETGEIQRDEQAAGDAKTGAVPLSAMLAKQHAATSTEIDRLLGAFQI